LLSEGRGRTSTNTETETKRGDETDTATKLDSELKIAAEKVTACRQWGQDTMGKRQGGAAYWANVMQPARKRGWFVERRLMALATGFDSVRIARAPNFISGITDMHFASTFSDTLL